MMHGQKHRDLKACGPAEQQFQIYEWSCKSTSEVLLVVSCREAVCQIHKIFWFLKYIEITSSCLSNAL